MTLDAVVFPHAFPCYNRKESPNMVGVPADCDFTRLDEDQEEKRELFGCDMGGGVLEMGQEQGRGNWYGLNENSDPSCSSLLHQNFKELDVNSLPESCNKVGISSEDPPELDVNYLQAAGRRKRQRTKRCKNKAKVEDQRMTHISVERNRRKQMNDYLAVLRSLMPPSYVQRGDQASIIGGAINFVKELEQLLQSLESQRFKNPKSQAAAMFSPPSPDFFSFPMNGNANKYDEAIANNLSAIANIEVTMVERHANLKILSKRRPKQLVMMVAGLQTLQLTTLHLNVPAVNPPMVLYSFSVKMEDGCKLRTGDEIANAVHQMLARIEEDAI